MQLTATRAGLSHRVIAGREAATDLRAVKWLDKNAKYFQSKCKFFVYEDNIIV